METEPKRFLWMLVCDIEYCHEFIPIYATSREDAQRRAEQWIREILRARAFVDLLPYPGGFTIHRKVLPGSI